MTAGLRFGNHRVASLPDKEPAAAGRGPTQLVHVTSMLDFHPVFARLRWIAALLLLLVPLQGLTAATRMLCGTGHAPAVHSIVSMERAEASHDAHVHAGDGSHDPHPHADGHHDAHGDVAVAGESGDVGVASAAGSCAHCAGCSVGSALTGEVTELVFLTPPYAVFPARHIAAASRPFDGPERPPRTV